MRTLLFVLVVFLSVCQRGFSQMSNFALGINYTSEWERFDIIKENASGIIQSTTKLGHNNANGLLLNYTLKNWFVFETGILSINRNYAQRRYLDIGSFAKPGQWVSGALIAVQSYSYKFFEIPLSTKVFLAEKNSKIRPFVTLEAKVDFLMNAQYSTYRHINSYSDSKNTYWGYITSGGLGICYFWRDYIFQADAKFRFAQKSKEDYRFLEVYLIKYENTYQPAFSLGVTVYRNLDFKKNTTSQ